MSGVAGSADGAPPPGEAARTWRRTWVGAVVVGVFGATPFFAYFGNLGFALLVGLAGFACLPTLLRRRRPDLGVAILLVLVIWAMASMLWSVAAPPHPDFSRHKAGELTALKLPLELALYGAFAIAALSLPPSTARRATLVLGIGLAAMAAVFMVDAVLQAPLYRAIRTLAHQAPRTDRGLRDLSRASYVLALLFWPAAVRFDSPRLRFVAAALAAATLVGAFVLNADAPVAAFGVATAVFFAVSLLGRPALIALLVGTVLYFAAAPVLIALFDSGQMLHPAPDDVRIQSWAIRLDIWRFAAARIHEHPYLGWGIDAARTFSPYIPLHTHNGAIQLWLELGAVGAGLAALFWSWILVQIDRLEAIDRRLAAAIAAAVSAYLTIGALSFGIWQEWWLALGALTAAVCIALAKARAAEVEIGPDLDGGATAP
ncbi:MAG TPA: O-antigen ligase family protein [Caulobacteraceae bacterium]|jgi:O-antigen ligase|nr:O-antigen ligase family protein [Caulobacteraceae bacterium]